MGADMRMRAGHGASGLETEGSAGECEERRGKDGRGSVQKNIAQPI
jgi:hypothetical protein